MFTVIELTACSEEINKWRTEEIKEKVNTRSIYNEVIPIVFL
jgi:hypothetical protein